RAGRFAACSPIGWRRSTRGPRSTPTPIRATIRNRSARPRTSARAATRGSELLRYAAARNVGHAVEVAGEPGRALVRVRDEATAADVGRHDARARARRVAAERDLAVGERDADAVGVE